jgi:hypothetical protein
MKIVALYIYLSLLMRRRTIGIAVDDETSHVRSEPSACKSCIGRSERETRSQNESSELPALGLIL